MKQTQITILAASVMFVLLMLVQACASYYQKTQKFQDLIYAGKIEKAGSWLQSQEKLKKGINKLLYLMNDGWTHWMLADYRESNNSLDSVDRMIENQRKNLSREGLALITNPGVKPYKPEDFEIVFVNYFKALNFLSLSNYEAALVECRRINIRLQALNDNYNDRKNRYSDDAFAHVMMGLIYESTNDINNAFIAYRNAWEAYRDVYQKNFGLAAPEQLKIDLLRTASQMGFANELRSYEREFNMRYEKTPYPGGELVFIWQNGFGPVKAEWAITFSIIRGKGGFVTFTNEELGLSFPFPLSSLSSSERGSLEDLSFVRVTFPKYVERPPVFTDGILVADSGSYPLQIAQDVNAIAFKTLHDRMLRELGNSLLRFTVKRAIEEGVRKESKELGVTVSIINMITEHADTRNWQTLPYSVSYARVYLPPGVHQLSFKMQSPQGETTHDFEVEVRENQTTFYTFQSLETHRPAIHPY